MNVFFVSNSPVEAAKFLCDSHVVKMSLESAQLICTALVTQGIPCRPTSDTIWQPNTVGYRPTHTNHPCGVWARAHPANLAWLWEHFDGLCAEYTARYGKVSLVETKLAQIKHLKPAVSSANYTAPAQAMPVVYKQNDAVEAYRDYYFGEKRRFAKWARLNNMPQWWLERLQAIE